MQNFVKNEKENRYYIYTTYYRNRSRVFLNGTISDLENSGMNETLSMLREPGDFLWYSVLVDERFLILMLGNETFINYGIVADMSTENLRLKKFNFPQNMKIQPFEKIGFSSRIIKNKTVLVFVWIKKKTIELWEFDMAQEQWNLIASLKNTIESVDFDDTEPFYPRTLRFFTVKITKDETDWRLFWETTIKSNNYNVTEIFSARFNYNDGTGTLVQVTDTKLITDDYYQGIYSFSFMATLFALAISGSVFYRTKRYKKLKHEKTR